MRTRTRIRISPVGLVQSVLAGIFGAVTTAVLLSIGTREVVLLAGISTAFGTGWLLTHPKRKTIEAVFDESRGYWRLLFGENDVYDICFAGAFERDRIPKPERRQSWGVGKIHCLAKDGFWVWREWYDGGGFDVGEGYDEL